MLEIFGDEYIMQHCVCEFKKKLEQRKIVSYITTGLYCLTNHKTLSRLFEFDDFKLKKEVSPEEIKQRIKSKLRG